MERQEPPYKKGPTVTFCLFMPTKKKMNRQINYDELLSSYIVCIPLFVPLLLLPFLCVNSLLTLLGL